MCHLPPLGTHTSHIIGSTKQSFNVNFKIRTQIYNCTRGRFAIPSYFQITRSNGGCATPAHTANEGPVRIQYKFMVPIYLFLEIKLPCYSKQNFNVLSPNFQIRVSVSIYTFQGLVCLFCCSQIGRLILGIYKSLTDT